MEVNRLINYIDENGKMIVNHLINSFLIKSEEDLSVLIDAKCPPGTQAYLIDESKIWELDANYEWKLKVLKSANSANNNNNNKIMKVEYIEEYQGLNKTWQEIYDAIKDGKIVIIFDHNEYAYYIDLVLAYLQSYPTQYRVNTGEISFYASTPDDYPVRND